MACPIFERIIPHNDQSRRARSQFCDKFLSGNGYTKEGLLKVSGLPASRHLVFIALMKSRMRRGLVASIFSSSRHGASNNPRAHTLMDKRRRVHQRPRTQYTKEGPFKGSGLHASRHLVFYFLAEITYASRPCCFYPLVFWTRRFKQPSGVYANGQKKAGAPLPTNPIYKRRLV